MSSKKYVKNPKTNRSILVGGPTWSKLVREGILGNDDGPTNTSEYVVAPKKQKKTRVRKDNVHQYATSISTRVLKNNYRELQHLPTNDLEKALESLIIQEMSGPTVETSGPIYGTGSPNDGDPPEEKDTENDESESDYYDESTSGDDTEGDRPLQTNDFSDDSLSSDDSDDFAGY